MPAAIDVSNRARLRAAMQHGNPLVLKLIQSGLLADEDHATLAELTQSARPVSAETVFVEQGRPAQGTPLVMSGSAYRYRLMRNGCRQILGVLLPGDFCDIQGAVLGSSDHFTAALTDAEIAWLSKETIDSLTLTRTRIAQALWWATLVDESILRLWLTNMGQLEVSRQLAHFLCEFHLRLRVVGHAEANGCQFPLRQDKLADILGVTRVHVSRTFSELRDEGLVELSSRRLTIPNVAKLWSHCDFDPSYLHLKRNDFLPER